MKLTKYFSTNILFLLGILLFILFILLEITDAYYDAPNKIYIDSLFEHYYIYITSILVLLILTPIEMLFHKMAMLNRLSMPCFSLSRNAIKTAWSHAV